MKTILKSALFLLILLPNLKAQVVQDPVAHFLTRMTRKPDDQLYKIIASVNRNGRKEVFLTYSPSMANGRAGYVWVVYAPVNGGYQCLDNLITFKPGALTVGDFPKLGGLGMLTYAPDAGGKGSLVGFVFDGASVQETNLGTIEFSGRDKSFTDKNFTKDKQPTLEITPSEKLPPLPQH